MILSGDVGGTKTNVALYRPEGGRLVRSASRAFASRDFPSLESILERFLEREGRPGIELACVGVAGPVFGRKSRLTNLPWVVERDSIRHACGARRSYLINDLQATAFAVPHLPPDGIAVLQAGEEDPQGVVAVLAAGTGLGMAFLARCGGACVPFASEGGHVDFAPRDGREAELLRYLSGKYYRVSAERVVSGPGLHAIYLFLREREGMGESPEIEARLAAEDPPRVIAEEGRSGASAACREALLLFVSLYGAMAGNVALQLLATGGVVLGGGIAPAILPVLTESRFLEAFRAKGRFRTFLSKVPVKVILDDTAALLGAAYFALAGGEAGE